MVEDWRDGMDKESIRQDKELARAAIKGLTAYAEQIAHQGKEDEIQQVRSLVDGRMPRQRGCSGGLGASPARS